MKHDKKTMNFQRKGLAILGVLLPILAPLLGLIAKDKNAPDFWYSISATYYATSGWIMAGVLFAFACFLFSYLGYDLGDRATCVFSAVMAICVLMFPCKCSAAGETTGIFNLPTSLSHVIHCISAAYLFGSFAYMIGMRFTKTEKVMWPTVAKFKRNRIYKTCALIILTAMAFQVLTSLLNVGWFTIINETIILWSFSFAWAVKANFFKRWRDDYIR